MIRALLPLLVALLFLGAVAVGVRALMPSRPRALTSGQRQLAIDGARWQAYTDVRPEVTVVGIRKTIATASELEVIGEMALASISPDEPDWEVAVSQALLAARVRADVLNAEEHPRQG